jgi:cohesin loading factor subunit SCC2
MGAGGAVKGTPGTMATKAEMYCREVSTQMVEVVKVSGSNEVLSTLVKGLLFGFAEGDKDKKNVERKSRQEDARNQCNLLVKALIELLLSFEETRAHKEDDGKELVAILATLGVFSQTYPELLVPHVDTLIPYLKGDNGAKRYEAAVVSQVSSMISVVSAHFSSGELSRLTKGELPNDLVNICYKFPSDAVTSAVEALAKLANHPDATSDSIQAKKLFKLATQFYSYLVKTKDVTNDFSSMKKSVRDNVRRALAALGSICRFYECEGAADDHNLDPSVFSVETDTTKLKLANNVLSNAAFALFLEYLNKEDASTKCLALRAMNGVFISRPRVVLVAEQLGIITSVIGKDAPPSVQVESLRCWRDILLCEEERIDSGAAKAKMATQKNVTLSKRIGGDQDGDACISGSVLTKHSYRLYELTLSKDDKVRYMIIDLIGHLLRQGLINPMETVPHLLAVQGDVKSSSTRALALKLLLNEGEKRPDMLRECYLIFLTLNLL